MATRFRIILFLTFLVLGLSVPKFHLIETFDGSDEGKGRRQKHGYFTVKLTVSIEPLYGISNFFLTHEELDEDDYHFALPHL